MNKRIGSYLEYRERFQQTFPGRFSYLNQLKFLLLARQLKEAWEANESDKILKLERDLLL